MSTVPPYVIFRQDLDAMLTDAARQEGNHPANSGEFSRAYRIHEYYRSIVIPSVRDDPWVHDAASEFAESYATECFHYQRLVADETWTHQQKHVDIQSRVRALVHRGFACNALTQFAREAMSSGEQRLLAVKCSDLGDLFVADRLSPEMTADMHALRAEAADVEEYMMLVCLRATQNAYVTLLPRIMYVIRRAIKRECHLPVGRSDGKLLDHSESLSWYKDHLEPSHPLYEPLVALSDYYKTTRNVASHPVGFSWHPDKNEIWLKDRGHLIRVPLYTYQQRYRYLVSYTCDYGVRAILSAYAEVERGPISTRLLGEYQKSFPVGFGAGPAS